MRHRRVDLAPRERGPGRVLTEDVDENAELQRLPRDLVRWLSGSSSKCER